MKKVFSLVLAVSLVVAAARFGFAQVDATVEKKAEKPDVVSVESLTSTATVVAIDYQNRTGVLKLPGGTTTTFRAGSEVRNFDSVKVGDQVLIHN